MTRARKYQIRCTDVNRRAELILARALTVVAIVPVVISVLANFVKREALDTSRFRDTSRALIADPTNSQPARPGARRPALRHGCWRSLSRRVPSGWSAADGDTRFARSRSVSGWTAVILAVVAFFGFWLSGPKARAVATRRALSPYLRRPEIAYGALVLAYLLLLWWRPTSQFGFWLNVTVYFALAVLGLQVLQRQTAREFPDTEPKGCGATACDIIGWRPGRARTTEPAGELERLALLRAEGALDDEEFAAAKAQILGARRAA